MYVPDINEKKSFQIDTNSILNVGENVKKKSQYFNFSFSFS